MENRTKHNAVDWGEVGPLGSEGEPEGGAGVDQTEVAALRAQLEALKLACQRPLIISEQTKRVRQFSGRGTADEPTAEDFAREIREAWELRPYSAQEKVAVIMSNVSGPARKELDLQASKTKSDPEALLETLLEAFAQTMPVREAEVVFLRSRQQIAESLRDFSHRLFCEHSVAVSQQRRERVECFSEARLRDQFVHGLNDSALRRELLRLVEEEPAITFIAVRNQALKWESQDRGNSQLQNQWCELVSSQLNRFGELLEALQHTPQANGQSSPYPDQPLPQTRTSHQVQWAVNRPTAPAGLIWAQTSRGFFPYAEDGAPVCINCWKSGHVANQCLELSQPETLIHSSAIGCSVNGLLPPVSENPPTIPKRQKLGKWCNFHNSRSHNLYECRSQPIHTIAALFPGYTNNPSSSGRNPQVEEEVLINGRRAKCLLDSGCSFDAIVSRSFVRPEDIMDVSVTLQSLDLDIPPKTVPLAKVHVKSRFVHSTITAAVLESSLYDIVLGSRFIKLEIPQNSNIKLPSVHLTASSQQGVRDTQDVFKSKHTIRDMTPSHLPINVSSQCREALQVARETVKSHPSELVSRSKLAISPQVNQVGQRANKQARRIHTRGASHLTQPGSTSRDGKFEACQSCKSRIDKFCRPYSFRRNKQCHQQQRLFGSPLTTALPSGSQTSMTDFSVLDYQMESPQHQLHSSYKEKPDRPPCRIQSSSTLQSGNIYGVQENGCSEKKQLFLFPETY
ncbi:uncharacterized protein LOC129926997 [Biomphalaria glabrata]|uniref:Uncharacterized protein LOC129925624 n=1 Tax=Biomphalaria glabrata TaxID=6526 RepID=A0A9W3A210_BIOGL|nr:uncharacterized protein LOC129925624 [Biomphalaria glabrata]XP_055890034.1 uncharacterized protein LOC129926997 [Biomphalaria glabrata]